MKQKQKIVIQIEVELDAEISIENDGIGKYEYGGVQGYDSGQNYFVCDTLIWDRSKYSQIENNVIEDYLDKNAEAIEKQVLELFENDNKGLLHN